VITQTAQGLAIACEEHFGVEEAQRRGVVIGFDHRFKSRRFAEITASAFVLRGHRVRLMRQICPTPFVPFAVAKFGACVGVMVTPSHNPPGYNGYKIYWGNAVQIIPPFDALIARCIAKNHDLWPGVTARPGPWHADSGDAKAAALCTEDYDEIRDSYMAAVVAKCRWRDPAANAASKLRVVYTAMQGIGREATERVLSDFGLPPFVPCVEQVDPDPDFSTLPFPNPEEKGALDLAIATADRENVPVVMAHDPDADRFALAERRSGGGDDGWRIFTGNEIALLLADWTWRHHLAAHPDCDRSKAVMLASTVSSKVLGAMSRHAEDGGFAFEETLTGFKWIGNKAKECADAGMAVIMAYEVEIGFVVGDVSFDKDGVRTLAAFCEFGAELYGAGSSFSDRVDALYARYGYFSMDNGYVRAPSDDVMDACFAALRKDGAYATEIAGEKVAGVRDLTTGYDSSKADKVAVLPHTPDAHMITYTLASGTTVTLRNSGTEPKLKYYVEASNPTSLDAAEKRRDEVTKDVIASLIRPEHFGFK
jgi:phosphoglucomutase